MDSFLLTAYSHPSSPPKKNKQTNTLATYSFFISPQNLNLFYILASHFSLPTVQLIVFMQAYHEEMLEKSPRREFLNKYAYQLLLRYPSLHEQVQLRMQRLHSQWQVVEAAITPQQGDTNTDSMMQGRALR